MINEEEIIYRNTDCGYISYYKNDIYICSALKERKTIFEHDLVFDYLEDIVKNSSVIIDGGAHAGSHTILYKHINPDVVIHAFEPQAKMFELLQHNVEANKLSNVFLYNLAIANKDLDVNLGTTVFDIVNGELINFENLTYGGEDGFNLGGIGIGHGGESIHTTTIDGLQLDACDFIKLDLEGAESIALYGAINTLKKFKPVILFESNYHQLDDETYKTFGVDKEAPVDILEALGYTVDSVGGDNYIAKWTGE